MSIVGNELSLVRVLPGMTNQRGAPWLGWLALGLGIVSCWGCSACGGPAPTPQTQAQAQSEPNSDGFGMPSPPASPGQEVAIFAGGCFWCMERPFDELDGVLSVQSGYTGGRVRAPSYDQVSGGGTGHAEAIRVVFDPTRVSYESLLTVFWHNIDPTQRDGQFCDHGSQYRSAVFTSSLEQRRAAEASRDEVLAALSARIGSGVVLATEITEATEFWPAEEYHQAFYQTHPAHYTEYRLGCGRDDRLRQLWGAEGGH